MRIRRRKLKQVQHLAQLIKPAIDTVLKEKEQPVLADLGAGKSYLGFILYDLYFGPAGRGKVIAVETRAELIATAKKIAEESGFRPHGFCRRRKSPIPEVGRGGHRHRAACLRHRHRRSDPVRAQASRRNMSRWCPAARRKWRANWKRRTVRWSSFGAIPSSGGNSAPISPMCCAGYFWRRMVTRCGSPNSPAWNIPSRMNSSWPSAISAPIPRARAEFDKLVKEIGVAPKLLVDAWSSPAPLGAQRLEGAVPVARSRACEARRG